MLRIAFFVLAVGLALTAFNLRGLLPDVPVAEQSPADCDASISRAVSTLYAPGTQPPLTDGQRLGLRAGAVLPPDPLGKACALRQVDVYVKIPGARSFVLLCTIQVIHEGEARICPRDADYEVESRDQTDGNLVAHVRVIADVVQNDFECTVPSHKRDPRRASNCIDASGIAVFGPVYVP